MLFLTIPTSNKRCSTVLQSSSIFYVFHGHRYIFPKCNKLMYKKGADHETISRKSLSRLSSINCLFDVTSAPCSLSAWGTAKLGADWDLGKLRPPAPSPLVSDWPPRPLASDRLVDMGPRCWPPWPLVKAADCFSDRFAPNWRAASRRLSDWLARQSVLKNGCSSWRDRRCVKVISGRPGVTFFNGTSPFN